MCCLLTAGGESYQSVNGTQVYLRRIVLVQLDMAIKPCGSRRGTQEGIL